MDEEIDYEDLEDRWYETEGDYRSRYPKLTDDDVPVEPGRFDWTIDRIGRKYTICDKYQQIGSKLN